jgi:hypothetical protein
MPRPSAPGGGCPPHQAAFVNGVLAHSLDYDDTHLPSILHPSASVVPAALAAGEAVGASGADVVVAAAVGHRGVRPARHGRLRPRGGQLHVLRTRTARDLDLWRTRVGRRCGPGLGLGADGVRQRHRPGRVDVLGIIEANRTGGTVKRLHCGWAAHAGVTAAELVRRGFTGPPTALEGRFGFYQAWLSGQFDPDEITVGSGSSGRSRTSSSSPIRRTTSPTPASTRRDACAPRACTPDDVEHALLEVAPRPCARSASRSMPSDARVRLPRPVLGPVHRGGRAVGRRRPRPGLEDFTDEAAARPDILDLMDRIDVAGDDELLQIYPNQFPARLTVRTRDGSVLVEEVLVNRGGPGDPLTDDELATKFRDNAMTVVDEVAAKELEVRIRDLASATDVSEVLAPICG